MAERVCTTDPIYVLVTTEAGTEAALRAAIARAGSMGAEVTLLVPHVGSAASGSGLTKRWQTLAVARRARHAIPFHTVLVEAEGRDFNDVVERETPSNAVIFIGGDRTPWWLPWRSYVEWLAGWLTRTGRTVEFVSVRPTRRPVGVAHVGGPRVIACRAIGHPPD